jgi:hypothetical protein
MSSPISPVLLNNLSDTIGDFSRSGDSLKKYYNGFKAEMTKLVADLADDSSTINIKGKLLDKSGAAATLAIDMLRSEKENAFSTLMDLYKFQDTVYKTLSQSA